MKKKKAEEKNKSTIREKVADSLDASKEIVLDVPKLVFIGNREVVVENYKSIVEYTDKKIALEANPCGLRLLGEDLEIKSITREMLYITGKIVKTEFGREE